MREVTNATAPYSNHSTQWYRHAAGQMAATTSGNQRVGSIQHEDGTNAKTPDNSKPSQGLLHSIPKYSPRMPPHELSPKSKTHPGPGAADLPPKSQNRTPIPTLPKTKQLQIRCSPRAPVVVHAPARLS